MTAGSRSSPAITSAGSPGNRCCSEKIKIDTRNSVGTSWAMRRARKFSMSVSRAPQALLELQSDHTHQPVRHLLVAFQPVGVCDQDAAVIEIEDRLILHDELGQFLVDRLALGHVGDEPGVIQRLVGILIAPFGVALWPA